MSPIFNFVIDWGVDDLIRAYWAREILMNEQQGTLADRRVLVVENEALSAIVVEEEARIQGATNIEVV